MRLVKVNDIILNMDNIAVIRSSAVGEDYGGGVDVYTYSAGQKIYLGHCDSKEDYQKWVYTIYTEFGEHFLGEMVSTDDDEEEPDLEELWGK